MVFPSLSLSVDQTRQGPGGHKRRAGVFSCEKDSPSWLAFWVGLRLEGLLGVLFFSLLVGGRMAGRMGWRTELGETWGGRPN